MSLPENHYQPIKLCGKCYGSKCYELNSQWGEEYDYCSQYTSQVKYTGKSVDEYISDKESKENMKVALEKEMERRRRVRDRKWDKAATTIQAFIRSSLSRMHHEEYVEERRVFMELRVEEAKARNSLMYKALGLIGLQPFLRSDTPRERLAKMYPRYLMNIIEECCDGNWAIAYALIREQEEFEFVRDAEASRRMRELHGMVLIHPLHPLWVFLS